MKFMKRRIAFSMLVALAAGLFSFGASAAEFIPGEYLVQYKDNPFLAQASLRSIGNLRVQDHNPAARLLKVKVSSVDELRTLERLVRDPNVARVTANFKLKTFFAPPTSVTLKEQWAIKKVNAEAAWAKAGNRGSRSVTIAVIDTGADYNHESLKPNMVKGRDFKENTDDPMDKTGSANPGHGTHCSGIMGGTGLIDGGVIGMSPEVSIMPLRFLGEDGTGDLNSAIKALDYAIEKKVDIISASWGASVARTQAQPLIDAVKRADDAGIIFIAAASNDGANNDRTDIFPANSGTANMISVAASGSNDERPSWSNYGKASVHVAAPGLDIMSTLPGNKYGPLSGTSMATPLVSGMVAFLKSQDKTLTGAQARSLLQLTGAKTQIETACNCRVDALAAVDMLISKKVFVTPAAASIQKGETVQFRGTHGRAPYKYAVANASVGTISNDGLFTAVTNGTTTVTVTDADGQTSTSLDVNVIEKQAGGDPGGGFPWPIPGEPGEPGPGPGNPGECPLGDKSLCDVMCQLQPELPFCKQ